MRALGVEIGIVLGGGNIFRGLAAALARHGPRRRRLHGHARDRDQRARAPARAREARRCSRASCPRSTMHAGRRAVHPPPRHAPPREGPRRDLRRPAPATRTSRPTPPPRCAPIEIGADVILKATKVDGVYDGDPEKHPGRRRASTRITLPRGARTQGLKVMDSTAISLCMDNRLPIVVFNVGVPGNLARVVQRRDRRHASWGRRRWPEDRSARRRRRAHEEGARVDAPRAGRDPHRARRPGAARHGPRRRTTARRRRSQQVALGERARAAPARGPAVGQAAWSRRSTKAIQKAGPRPEPDRRRHGRARADPDAHRGAPQGPGEAHRQARRGRPRRACARSAATRTTS